MRVTTDRPGARDARRVCAVADLVRAGASDGAQKCCG